MNLATGLALGMALSQLLDGELPLWFIIGLVLMCVAILGLGLYVVGESFK